VDAIRDKIEQVLQAEDEAKRMIEDARNQSDLLLRNAREKVLMLMETMLAEADTIILEEKANKEAETARILSDLKRQSESEIQTLKHIGTSSIPVASSHIVKSIMG